jgi:hypothetical protein
MYDYISFLQEGAFEELFYGSRTPWVVLGVLVIALGVLFMRSRKREGVE